MTKSDSRRLSMPTFARVFPPMQAWTRSVTRCMWSRQERKRQAKMAASDALELLHGGLAAYLSDTHGAPKTLCDSLDLLDERRICILALLHAVQDRDARKFLELGLIKWLSVPTWEIVFRSGVYMTVHLPTRSTDETN